MAFDITKIFDTNIDKKNSEEKKFAIINIPISKIVPNENNFYSVKEIEKLKTSIKAIGLKHNLVVSQNKDTNTYTIISGHRRYKAMQELIADGEDIGTIPCKIEDITELEQKLTLILANSTSRELTSFEKMKQVEEMKLLANELRQNTDIKGKTRDIIAELLHMSTSEVGRYEAISKNLNENIKDELEKENISTNTAYEISKLDKEQQKEVAEVIEKAKEDNKKITADEIKNLNLEPELTNENKVNQIDAHKEIEVLEDNKLDSNLEPELTRENIVNQIKKYEKIISLNKKHIANLYINNALRQDIKIETAIEIIKNNKLILLALENLLLEL
ncbi:MAG: ParB/RepB/Spo0J family partition protein [Lachnospirales bacterium]